MSAPGLTTPVADGIPRFETLWLEPEIGAHRAVACLLPESEVSRAELCRRVDALAATLIGSPRPALLACENTFNFALGFCALLRAGRDIVLPPNVQAETLRAETFAHMERIDDRAAGRDLPMAQLPAAALDPAHPVTLFTSGSTGEPKRVDKQLRQLSAEMETLDSIFGERLGTAAVAATVPHIHIYGMLFRVLWPLMAGRPFQSEAVLGGNLSRARDCVLVSSPAFLRRIDRHDLASSRPHVIFSSGGRLPEADADAIARAAGCPVIEIYGSTETGGIAWREWPADPNDGGWTTFDGVATRISESRLHVRSDATGGAWLDTGDSVSRRTDGHLRLEGRADGVIKIEDKRVSLAAIADWLEGHEWVAEARVTELPGRRGQLGAVLALTRAGNSRLRETGRTPFSRRLRAYVQRRFEAVVVPRKWRYVTEMPVNAMGKTTARELVALFNGVPHDAP